MAAGMEVWRERYNIIHFSNAPKSKFGSENGHEKLCDDGSGLCILNGVEIAIANMFY